MGLSILVKSYMRWSFTVCKVENGFERIAVRQYYEPTNETTNNFGCVLIGMILDLTLSAVSVSWLES